MDNVNLIGSYSWERARINLKLRGKFFFKKILLLLSSSPISLNSFIAWELCFPIARGAGFITIPPIKMRVLSSENLALIRMQLLMGLLFPLVSSGKNISPDHSKS